MAGELPRASVEVLPLGRRAEVPAGMTTLAAAQSVGVGLASACGGLGAATGAWRAPASTHGIRLDEYELEVAS
jgi:hypothetical protein